MPDNPGTFEVNSMSHSDPLAQAVLSGMFASQDLQLCWYAACTCPRHERVVAHQLDQRAIECFLPSYAAVRRWKDRKKEIHVALFPGYVFVRIDLKDRLRVLQLPGVVRFVSFNGRPAVLPENDIEALRNTLAHRVPAESHPYLRAGHRVQVVSGPLAGTEGILVRKKDKLRVVISIEAIRRAVAVEIDQSDIEPIF